MYSRANKIEDRWKKEKRKEKKGRRKKKKEKKKRVWNIYCSAAADLPVIWIDRCLVSATILLIISQNKRCEGKKKLFRCVAFSRSALASIRYGRQREP